MKIYICASLENAQINRQVAELLEAKGHTVHLPQRDTPQSTDDNIYDGNIIAIKSSDLIVAIVSPDRSPNWGFEIGYAMAKGTPVICLYKPTEREKMIIPPLHRGNNKIVHSIEELEKCVEGLRK